MLGKHSLSTANAYDTEALEDALEGACGGNIKITQRLELRRLATSLWYDTEMNKQGTIQQNHNEPLKALTNIKANLQRRKKTSDIFRVSFSATSTILLLVGVYIYSSRR